MELTAEKQSTIRLNLISLSFIVEQVSNICQFCLQFGLCAPLTTAGMSITYSKTGVMVEGILKAVQKLLLQWVLHVQNTQQPFGNLTLVRSGHSSI